MKRGWWTPYRRFVAGSAVLAFVIAALALLLAAAV